MRPASREDLTLQFTNDGLDRGAVEETFYPWQATIEAWEKEGLSPEFCQEVCFPHLPSDNLYMYKNRGYTPDEHMYHVMMTDAVFAHETRIGLLDPVKRMAFRVPFQCFDEEILEQTAEYTVKRNMDGWVRKYHANRDLVEGIKPVVTCMEDWIALRTAAQQVLAEYGTAENREKNYGKYREGCANGDFSIRFRLAGFFWVPRELMGDINHLYALYDEPELIHSINTFLCETYIAQMEQICKLIKPNVVLIEEDLSGTNGPMLSPAHFDEYIGAYYRRLVPALKSFGVKHVFVDTDGDFQAVIPNFMKAGIDSFLPMDVNAGMNIVEVRKQYPTLKFIGAYNKLEIAKGPEAIDAEFERLKPVIRQGGYMCSCDHQPAPSTKLEYYFYYLKRLKEVMSECRGEGAQKNSH